MDNRIRSRRKTVARWIVVLMFLLFMPLFAAIEIWWSRAARPLIYLYMVSWLCFGFMSVDVDWPSRDFNVRRPERSRKDKA